MNTSPDTNTDKQATLDPVFILVFDTLPAFDIGRIADGLRSLEPLKQDVTYEFAGESADGFVATVMFDDHQIQLAGLNAPVPPGTIEQTVASSRYKPELTKAMRAGRAQIVCYYQGHSADPVEQLMAMEKIAGAFLPMGLLGLLDPGAWNCRPREVMEKVDLKMLRACLQGDPLSFSIGFVKFIQDNGVWFCTKGQHRFGLPDLAWFAPLNQGQFVYDAFGKLFLQMRETGTRPQVGDTAAAGEGIYVRFREVYEYHDWLNGPAGTLVVEPTNEAEARTGGPTGAGTLHEQRDQAVFVKEGDEAMDLVFSLSRDSMPHFWEVFANPQNGEDGFGLKVRISDRYGSEQFWMGDIEQKDGQIYGRVNNDPNVVKTVKKGQRLVLPPEDTVDWMYFRNGKVVGNYTARALVRTMPAAEAKKYRQMMSDFVPLKVNCACGQHYAFEIEAPGGRMPGPVQCPACGADGTAAANEMLAAIFEGKGAGQAGAPKAQSKLSLASSSKTSAPPPLSTARTTAPRKTASGSKPLLIKIGAAIGGLAVLLVLGIALLVFIYKPRHPASPHFPSPPRPASTLPPAAASPGDPARAAVSRPAGPPVFFHSRHATFTDLQGNEYNDVVLTIADGRGLSYYKPGSRPGIIPFTNLPTAFLIDLKIPTNWPGVVDGR